jgi:hypothetical protein
MKLTWLAIHLRLRMFARGDQSRASIRSPVIMQIAVPALEMHDVMRHAH